MKTHVITFLFWACAGFVLQAQSIAPQVVANAGEVMKASGFSLEWTLGELATETLSGGNSKITQGFHQGSFIVTSVSNPELDGLSVYPNPFYEKLVIENSKDRMIRISVTDLKGSEIHRQVTGMGNTTLDLGTCPAGVLILQIQSGEERSVFKIEKFK